MTYLGSKKCKIVKCFQFILVITELFLGLGPVNKGQRYFVMTSLIDWVQA